ncbi:unnamed protein product [Lepeophtheirus salmonis]|uniref:(salmon louse) hypothetical protein n=1 Tax=Lepeophtheirus salmonis TaxID=72036 RepID=A0A7R8CCI9_LEPSM|nr:unnamed protein product [Lepeophtheirus salmonis]CAF2769609.1 unnamed protein product [Lepeophtheirus salmonis]
MSPSQTLGGSPVSAWYPNHLEPFRDTSENNTLVERKKGLNSEVYSPSGAPSTSCNNDNSKTRIAFQENMQLRSGRQRRPNQDFELGRLVKVMMAMAFVPHEVIVQVWEETINIEYSRNVDGEEEFDNFYEYIGKTNCHGRRSRPRIEHGLWNHFGRIQEGGKITNNAMEGFNIRKSKR